MHSPFGIHLHRRYVLLATAAVFALAGALAAGWRLVALDGQRAQVLQQLQLERSLIHRIAGLATGPIQAEGTRERARLGAQIEAAASRLQRVDRRLAGNDGRTALLPDGALRVLYRKPPLVLQERTGRFAEQALRLATDPQGVLGEPDNRDRFDNPGLRRLDEDIGTVVFEARRWFGNRLDRWRLLAASLVAAALALWLSTLALVVTPALTLSARAEGRLREREGFLRSLTDEFTDALVMIDEKGRIETFNPAAERVFGYSAREIMGKNIKLLMPEPDRSQHDGYLERYRRDGVKRMVGKRREVTGLRKDGAVVDLELAVSEHREGPHRHFMGALREIGEERRRDREMNERLLESLLQEVRQRREVQRELTRLANTDHLTGVYNRTIVEERLDQGIEVANRYDTEISLVILDIDHFKAVNDSHGHLAGDQVLRQLAAVVSENLRAADIFARWGGEEFVVLAPETGLEAATALAERIRAALHRRRFDEVGAVTASFGVAAYQAGEGRDAFIARADAALYRAKEEGRDRVCAG